MIPWRVTRLTNRSIQEVLTKFQQITDETMSICWANEKSSDDPKEDLVFGGRIDFRRRKFKLVYLPELNFVPEYNKTIYQGKVEQFGELTRIRVWVRHSVPGLLADIAIVAFWCWLTIDLAIKGWHTTHKWQIGGIAIIGFLIITTTWSSVREAKKKLCEMFPN